MTLLSVWHPALLRRCAPGIALAAVVALSATFIADSYGGPQLLYALFFGLAFHFLAHDPVCQPGIDWCSRTLLRTGVALLGLRITLGDIGALGAAPLLMVVVAVATTLGFGWLLARRLGRPASEGWLSGGAVGICGASAALAIAAVLPQTKENEKFTLLVVVGVTTLSTVAMIMYPLLVQLLGLAPGAAGIFLGGTIHDVAQVVGAGYLISPQAGDVATVVKLTRVACLVPVVLGLTLLFHSGSGRTAVRTQPLMPVFLIGFVWCVLANSFDLIPQAVAASLLQASRACLVMAIAALGVKTSFQALAALGWRPVVLLVAETVWLAGFVLIALIFIN
jgi:uncharacterized integral membrane protein (TIGR00698 family)